MGEQSNFATVKNLKFEGKLNLNAVQANVRMFGASFTSEAYGTFNAENVEVNTVFTTEGSKLFCYCGLRILKNLR